VCQSPKNANGSAFDDLRTTNSTAYPELFTDRIHDYLPSDQIDELMVGHCPSLSLVAPVGWFSAGVVSYGIDIPARPDRQASS
jgi:hypothetical protein